jgi:hypothetical protein
VKVVVSGFERHGSLSFESNGAPEEYEPCAQRQERKNLYSMHNFNTDKSRKEEAKRIIGQGRESSPHSRPKPAVSEMAMRSSFLNVALSE